MMQIIILMTDATSSIKSPCRLEQSAKELMKTHAAQQAIIGFELEENPMELCLKAICCPCPAVGLLPAGIRRERAVSQSGDDTITRVLGPSPSRVYYFPTSWGCRLVEWEIDMQ